MSETSKRGTSGLKTAWFKEISLVSLCTHAFTMLSASLFWVESRHQNISDLGWAPVAMVTIPTDLRLGFQ